MSDSAADRNVALENGDNGEKMLPPTDVCLKLNERFLDQINTGHYFTAVVGELDLNTGHFVFAQAGHPHPVLQTAEDEKVLIGNGGPPIGLLPDVTFDAYETTIPPGGRLLIYSDGVTECPDPEGDMLDEDGLLDFLTRHADVDGDALLDTLKWELSARVRDADLPDDVSATLIERRV